MHSANSREQPFSTNMVPFKSLFIDDLCVDKQTRGQHIGESLFEYVKQQAKELGCYEVTLNVWAGNTSAEHFYEKMGMKTKRTGRWNISCEPDGGGRHDYHIGIAARISFTFPASTVSYAFLRLIS